MKIIERLSGSRVSAKGTKRSESRSIQEIAGATEVSRKKITQLPRKLPRTAPTEIKALVFREGRVATMMMKAAASGRRRTIQGSITYGKTSPLKSVRVARLELSGERTRLACTVRCPRRTDEGSIRAS